MGEIGTERGRINAEGAETQSSQRRGVAKRADIWTDIQKLHHHEFRLTIGCFRASKFMFG